MKLSILALIIAVLAISSCSERNIYVFVSNGSDEDTVVKLDLYVNKEKKLSQAFRYTSVIPHEEEFKFSIPRTSDSIVLDITSNTGVVKNNVKVPYNEKYIFIVYAYKTVADTVFKPRDVVIASYKKMPQRQ